MKKLISALIMPLLLLDAHIAATTLRIMACGCLYRLESRLWDMTISAVKSIGVYCGDGFYRR